MSFLIFLFFFSYFPIQISKKVIFRLRSDDRKAQVRDLECQFNSLNAARFQSYISRLESNMKDDPKHFWKYLRSRTSNHGIPEIVNYRGVTSSTLVESASLFSSLFRSVLSNNSPPLSETYLNRLPTFDLNLPTTVFTERAVFAKLRDVDNSTGPGSDGLPPSFIKECATSLALPASVLFNRSLAENIFPLK